ncbi:MAG: hypothetical protein ACI8QZ_000575 [Chlamydiales bacterium]|jgi:hypothetical protein
MASARGAADGAATAQPQGDGVVCFAGVDWWYHNRGHSECQIMRRLAQRLPVLWVNSLGMRAPVPGKTELPFRRYARKLKSTMKGLRRDPCGLWIYSPLFVPKYSPRMLAFNGAFVGAQVRMLTRRLGMQRPATWVTIPTAYPVVKRREWNSVIFNRSDDFSSFPEVNSELIGGLENELLAASDRVLYVNRVLFNKERERVNHGEYLDHGVDFDHFAGSRDVHGKALCELPPKLRGLQGPLVGFYGALDDYTVDLDLMIAAARHIHPATLVVVGPKAMEIGRLTAEPNVAYLGPVSYEELPTYAAHFAIGIMPWLRNEWIKGCNPIKLKEYLALGFPIVSTPFPELDRYASHVYQGGTTEEFCGAITAALEERDPARVRARREAVEHCSWDALADRVQALMGVV